MNKFDKVCFIINIILIACNLTFIFLNLSSAVSSPKDEQAYTVTEKTDNRVIVNGCDYNSKSYQYQYTEYSIE